jgi:AcrR family transcriptional regulator
MSSSPTRPAPPPDQERRQILDALAEVCIREGYRKASVDSVVEEAGTTRVAFDRHFADLEDCFAAYILETREAFLAEVGGAVLQHAGWREQMRAAAYGIVRFWQEDVRRARMILIEVHSAGPRAQLVRDEGMQMMVALIDQGRSLMPDPDLLTRATAEAVAGAIMNQMRLILDRGEADRAQEHVAGLMYSVVLPYVGSEAALEELEIPPPEEG